MAFSSLRLGLLNDSVSISFSRFFPAKRRRLRSRQRLLFEERAAELCTNRSSFSPVLLPAVRLSFGLVIADVSFLSILFFLLYGSVLVSIINRVFFFLDTSKGDVGFLWSL